MDYFKIPALGFVLLTICAASSIEVKAQGECMPRLAVDHPYWLSDIVFSGTAERVTHENARDVARFHIDRVYRGLAGKIVDIESFYPIKENESYFVYAVNGRNGRLGIYNDGPCGTAPIEMSNAREDLEYAEEIASGRSGTRISGVIYGDRSELGGERRPIPDVEVTIRNKHRKLTTKTDANGKYIFKDIPTGLYHVEARFPQGMREKGAWPRYYPGEPNRDLHDILIGEYFAPDMFTLTPTNMKQASPPPNGKWVFRHTAVLNLVATLSVL